MSKPMFLPVTLASENADGVAYIEISKIVAMERFLGTTGSSPIFLRSITISA